MKRIIAGLIVSTMLGVSSVSADDMPMSGVKTKWVTAGVDVGWLTLIKDRSFQVEVINEAKEGCWTGDEQTKTALELELKRSHFTIDDEGTLSDSLIRVQMIGLSSNGTCAISYEFNYMTMTYPHIGAFAQLISAEYRSVYARLGVIMGPKDFIKSNLKDSMVEIVQDFLNLIDKRQKLILANIEASDNFSDADKLYWRDYIAGKND